MYLYTNMLRKLPILHQILLMLMNTLKVTIVPKKLQVFIMFFMICSNIYGQNTNQAGLFGSGGDETAPPLIKPQPLDVSLQNSDYLNPKLTIEQRIDNLMHIMTLEEKIALYYGAGPIATGNIERLGIPVIGMADGPQGVRLEKGTATGFPIGIAMAATWNTNLIQDVGKAIGEECLAFNRRVIFGPGVNMMRSPLGGRNYEYFGEDPLLTGKIAAAYIRGTQSVGVAACPKHWILNDQEVRRNTIDISADQQAFREIYVKPFEIMQEESTPWAIMTSNSKVYGAYASENEKILNDLLFNTIGYDGAVISDWMAVHDEASAINAGCTLIMPTLRDQEKINSIKNKLEKGEISKTSFETGVRKMLKLFMRVGAFDVPKEGIANNKAHQDLALQTATESIVLLKNDNQILPLDNNKVQSIAIIGPNADFHHTMSINSTDPDELWHKGGSGAVRPPYEITPLTAFLKNFKGQVTYAPGYTFEETITKQTYGSLAIEEAVEAAKKADVAIVFAGINHELDGEGRGYDSSLINDRKNMDLIGPQIELITRVVEANPKTIVVLINGSPVSLLPWHDKVPAIIEAWYGNQEAGTAIKNIIMGEANPSGKLPFTWGKRIEDYSVHQFDTLTWPGTGEHGKMEYKEGIQIGYRGFDAKKIKPLYSFGHGLSYTKFSFKKLNITRVDHENKKYEITLKLKNTGKVVGKEVVQVYILPPNQKEINRPLKELKGFVKVDLLPSQSQDITITLDKDAFSYFDTASNQWTLQKGVFQIAVGSSSSDIRITKQISIK